MTDKKKNCSDGCKGCNLMNPALIIPLHKMTETDFKKIGIDYWLSDFGDVFSNGT